MKAIAARVRRFTAGYRALVALVVVERILLAGRRWELVSLLQERMREPLHEGPLVGANCVGSVGNPACGDVVTMHVLTSGGIIKAASFESVGSAYQLATASILCDCVVGHTVEHAKAQTHADVLDCLPDLPQDKRYLARLALEALQRALANGEKPPSEAGGTPMDMGEAQGLVLELLGNGRQWGTMELDAMARADERNWPAPLVKLLAEWRQDGTIAGEMAGSSWRWWLP